MTRPAAISLFFCAILSVCVAACPSRAAARPLPAEAAPAAGSSAGPAASPADTTVQAGDTSAAARQTGSLLSRMAAQGADTAAAAPAAAKTDRVVPANGTFIKANENDVSLANTSRISIDPGSGWTLSSMLSAEERRYRTQKITDVSENFMAQATKVSEGFYALNIGVGQNYSKKKTLGLGRFGKDIVIDNQSANAAYSLVSPLLGAAASRLTVQAEGRRGTNDFKFDRSAAGSVSGSVAYAAGALGVSGGFGAMRRVESSEIGTAKFSRMPSDADTIRAGLSYGSGDKKTLDVRYLQSSGVERRVMPPLGNSLEILDDPSKAEREEARGELRQLDVRSSLVPFSYLSMDVRFMHKLDSQKYLVDSRRSGESENTSIEATGAYRYAKSGTLRLSVSRGERVNDYGPKSLSSMTIREYSLRGGITQLIGDSLQFTANGSGRLQQNFYKQSGVNPRDADDLSYSGDATLRAKILPRVSADITAAASRSEKIYIDGTLSGDNRVDYQYRLGPTIRLKPLRWISLTQDYIVKIEYTDFLFTEAKNYLNRTTTLNTRADMNPTRRTAILFRHSYLMKDTGSYLQREGRELYSPNSKNVEHTLAFDVRYMLSPEFLLKAQADFRTQESGIYGVVGPRRAIVRTTVYDSGGFKVGFMRKKEIWNAGSVDLDVAYARNYGTYITEARKQYWEVNSAVNLKF